MRSLLIATSAVVCGLAVSTQAQLLPFLAKPNAPSDSNNLGTAHQNRLQQPMDGNLGIQLPPPSDKAGHSDSAAQAPNGGLSINDIIGSQRNIGIFAGFTRDIDSVSQRLDSTSKNTTVLAPLNSAISGLPRKPWEDPQEYAALGESAYAGSEGESRAHANLRRFTEAHIITASPWQEGEKVQSMLGGKYWWEQRDGKTFVHPGNIEVEKILNKAGNGEIWVIKGVLNYAA